MDVLFHNPLHYCLPEIGDLTLKRGRCGPGSSVGIATDYGLDGPGIKWCFLRHIYASQHDMALTLKGAQDVRIMTQHPTTPCYKVWGESTHSMIIGGPYSGLVYGHS